MGHDPGGYIIDMLIEPVAGVHLCVNNDKHGT